MCAQSTGTRVDTLTHEKTEHLERERETERERGSGERRHVEGLAVEDEKKLSRGDLLLLYSGPVRPGLHL